MDQGQVSQLTSNELEQEDLHHVLLPEQFGQLLTLYLIENDLLSAKFLWKRIPHNVKQSEFNGEFLSIWKIVLLLLKKDYTNSYSAIKKEWSPTIKPLMEKLRYAVQNRVLDLVSRSYSSIKVDDLVSLIDLNADQTVSLVKQKGWVYEEASRMIEPVVARHCTELALSSQRQLSLLSSYVSFLEN